MVNKKNIGRLVDYDILKKELSKYIPEADYSILSRLGYFMLNKETSEEDLEMDMGSSIIESLLDEIENSDYEKVKTLHGLLKSQGVLK